MNAIRRDVGDGVSIEADGNAIRITLITHTAEHATRSAEAMRRELEDGRAVMLTLIAKPEGEKPEGERLH